MTATLITVVGLLCVAYMVVDVIRGCPGESARVIRRWLIGLTLLWVISDWWSWPRHALLNLAFQVPFGLLLWRAYRIASRRESRDRHEAIR